MTLQQELAEHAGKMMKVIPEELLTVIAKADADLAETEMDKNILGAGEVFPEVMLKDALGNDTSIQDLLKNGPVIVSFYRGGWCPYCNIELKNLQSFMPEFKKVGLQLVAVSPETPDNSLTTKEKNELAFPVLSDQGNVLSKKLGLTFKLTDEIIDIYNKFELNVDKHNGNDLYELPLPGTYLIGKDGVILFAQASTDYKTRTEPSEILKYLNA